MRRITAAPLLTLIIFLSAFWVFTPFGSEAAPKHNWSQWRGPEGNGISPETNLPAEWSDTRNIKWKTPIPGRGHSSPVVWDKPADVAATFASPRIWKWLTFAWGPEHRPLIASYAAWLRRDWNERHGAGREVIAQAVHYMLEETGPPGEEPARAKLTIYEWSESGGERVRSHDECPGSLPGSPGQASPQGHRPL